MTVSGERLVANGAATDAVGVDAHSYADDLAEELEEAQALADRVLVPSDLPPDRFLDREESWLSFNARVLELAMDARTPLLERVRYVAIFASNLDEFFMVRVAGITRRIATGTSRQMGAGLSARRHLDAVQQTARALMVSHAAVFAELRERLQAEGVVVASWANLDEAEQARLGRYFAHRVYPVLTPLAVDPAHPFPHISGLSLNLAVMLRDPVDRSGHFARVKVPSSLPRLVAVGESRFVLIEELIAAQLSELFVGMDVEETHVFRVTRNEDVDLGDDEVDDLLQAMERELTKRRFGPPMRLEVQPTMSARVRDLLVRELGVSEDAIYQIPGPLDLATMSQIADLDLPHLKYPPFVATTPDPLCDLDPHSEIANVFDVIQRGDLLVHHPYDSFHTTTEALIEEAAADPDVLALKMTLYRTSGESLVVEALADAARAGKQVVVLVEIKARFDERANIRWARALEQAGAHVVYGLVGLKTHCKLCLVIRRERSGELRRYVHFGTGNYNPKTAKIYEDFGLFTADEEVGADATQLFNQLSGYAHPREYRRMLVAPHSIRSGLKRRIETEIDNAQRGRRAGITIKVNSLVDEEVIDSLYRASRAGVPVDLIVRGMCALRPGLPGLSESIRVRSILGRFLEHSRVFRFCNDGNEEVWLGSADLMPRNLDRRVEALVQICDPGIRGRVTSLLELGLEDRIESWELASDGTWSVRGGGSGVDYQAELIDRLQQRTR